MSLNIQKLSKLSMLLISICHQNYQYTYIYCLSSFFPSLYEEVEFLLSWVDTMSWVLEFRCLQGEGSAKLYHPPWLVCSKDQCKNISSSSNTGAEKGNGSEGTWQIGELLLLSHFSCSQLCTTPQMAAHQAPPSLGFSRQEYWNGLPFPSPMHESEKSK